MNNEQARRMVAAELARENRRRRRGIWPEPALSEERLLNDTFKYNGSVIGLGSNWGFPQAGMIHFRPGKHPMGRLLVKSLYKHTVLVCPELKDWKFIGWQFCRYNRRIQEALGYYYYQPSVQVAEAGNKVSFKDYTPSPLWRATTYGLANCGFKHITVSDVPNQSVLGEGWDGRYVLGRPYPFIDPTLEYQTRTINSLTKRVPVGIAVRAAVIDWVLHPERLDLLKKITEDKYIRIIRSAHVSRRTGHACLRLMVGRQPWKTWREILEQGTGSKEIKPEVRYEWGRDEDDED